MIAKKPKVFRSKSENIHQIFFRKKTFFLKKYCSRKHYFQRNAFMRNIFNKIGGRKTWRCLPAVFFEHRGYFKISYTCYICTLVIRWVKCCRTQLRFCVGKLCCVIFFVIKIKEAFLIMGYPLCVDSGNVNWEVSQKCVDY